MSALKVQRVDYLNAHDAQALVFLLDAYAQDPMGGGEALQPEAAARLCANLSCIASAASFIAWLDGKPIGLINCFEGYSTFKARPLLNVHDIAVLAAHRGQGVGHALLQAAEAHARSRGCCKLTLEVLSGNSPAMASYKRFGFEQYELDPAAGQAQFMQKWL
ncbi:MAG: Mycothiol acetyltransferase [Pseudomonadota bacterium]|jgi:GNAT superfamily N-acetyltransferase